MLLLQAAVKYFPQTYIFRKKGIVGKNHQKQSLYDFRFCTYVINFFTLFQVY